MTEAHVVAHDGLVDHEVSMSVGRRGPTGDVDEILIAEVSGDDGTWSLPIVRFRAEEEATEPTGEAVERLLGRPVGILRMTWAWYATEEDEEDEQRELLADAGVLERCHIEVEPVDGDAPAGYRWVAWRDLDPASLRPGDLREPFERWAARQAHGPGPLEPPWSRPGWFDRASAWMVERMAAIGRPPTALPRLHYMWALSAVLRAEAADGTLYLKSSPEIFRDEGPVTARLGTRAPGLVTSVVAVEPVEAWTLMDDLGGEAIGDEPPERWRDGLVTHAAIQRAWLGHTDELLAVGARSRPLAELAALVPGMADRPATRAHLSDADVERWHAAVPTLIAACQRLDAIGPPSTIVHGDLHPWNVVRGPAGPMVFDWTDSAVGQPFVDLAAWLVRTPEVDRRREMLAAYVGEWSDLVRPDDLSEAGELGFLVGCLYQVEAYAGIIAAMDPVDRREMHAGDASWLRRALRVLDDGIAASWGRGPASP
jgi:hypothetical protein